MNDDNHVCPQCFNVVDSCKCGTDGKNFIHVDKNIQSHVRILNEKGYVTTESCESHNQHGNMYISFVRDYDFDKSYLPSGFKLFDNVSGNGKTLSFMYPRNTGDEEFAIIKRNKLESLFEWCYNLVAR